MKKILSLLLAAVMLFTIVIPVFAAVKGDVDGDGSITAADARIALRMAVGLDTATDEQKLLADYNESGTVDASDARILLRLSVGLSADEKPVVPEKPVEKPVHVPSEREKRFYQNLYDTAHPLLGSYPAIYDNSNPLSFMLKSVQKWCCYHTINNVFRPALEKSGYTKEQVDLLAPRTFSRDSLAKLLTNVVGFDWSDKFVVDSIPLYVPSLLSDYYIKTPEAADVYFLHDFKDEMIENKVYEHSDTDVAMYTPRVGDILFISNKTKSYVDGYPTVDHTAQIIKVNKDGTFVCTEGSLIDQNDPSGLARVQERSYMFYDKVGAYCYADFDNRLVYPNIVVLYAAQPKF